MDLRVNNFKPGEKLILVKIMPEHFTLTTEDYYFDFCDEVLAHMPKDDYKRYSYTKRYLAALAVVEPYLKVRDNKTVKLKTFASKKDVEVEELDEITRIKVLKKNEKKRHFFM